LLPSLSFCVSFLMLPHYLFAIIAVTGCAASTLSKRALASGSAISKVTQAQWKALNATVEGRLALGQPLALPCFDDFSGQSFKPSPNAEQCAAIQSQWSVSSLHSSQYGGYENVQWAGCIKTGEQCVLDRRNPTDGTVLETTCSQGSVSTYYINVAKASDVTAAYEFSKKTGVPLNIKNTGHEYSGRSSAPDSLGLWTHNLRAISHKAAFKPAGCKQQFPSMTIGAGQQFAEIYKYAEDNGFTVAGGTSSTVGMSGGWIAGGGHSAVSGAIGLGTDNVLEFKVVTPKSSEVIVASRCQNQDVFFALAGGGHNTVGVVLESTHKTHPVMPLQVASIAILTPNAEAAQKLMELSASRALEFTNCGWGGYLALTPRVGEVSAVLMVNWKLDTAEATKDMQPIIDFVASLPKENVLINGVFPVKSFYEAC